MQVVLHWPRIDVRPAEDAFAVARLPRPGTRENGCASGVCRVLIKFVKTFGVFAYRGSQ